MSISPQIEPTSTTRLLICLDLAIDETKLVRSINQSREAIGQLEAKNPSSHRLLFLRREVSNLEVRLAKVRNRAGRIKTVLHLDKF
ncbi:MAG: hypothetical protein GY896_11105 [Gammaproteobacteria bacterium]|nr:hypothetical protein [Gammaproteobacteria bacterium]